MISLANTSNVLEFLAAGNRNYIDGTLHAKGEYGYYWSSDAYGNNDACFMCIGDNRCVTNANYSRHYGLSVRCVRQ